MRRFTVISAVFIVSILAALGIIGTFAASSSGTASGNVPIQVRAETDEMLKASQSGASAVPLTSTDRKIAPVFDATGAIISDPTGTMLNARNALDTSNQLSPAEQPIYLEGGYWLETGWDGNWRVHR